MTDELTTEMHGELLGAEIPDLDLRIMGAFGIQQRGAKLKDALTRYNLTSKEYFENFDRVITGD